MRYKADWSEAQRRLTALWHRERLDRPCVAVRAPQPVENAPLVQEPVDDEARWLDPIYRMAVARRELENTWWGGEAVPSCLQLAGWVICLGGAPRFARETIWFETRQVDFDQPSPFQHEMDSEWLHKYRTLLHVLCTAAGRDDFLIGQPCILPACDLLAMHMGTEAFLLALTDHPEWMAAAILTGARDQLRACQDLQALVRACGHEYWYGNAGWMAFWAPEPYIGTQSDVSCMLSPEMFDRFVVPELDVYGEEFGALWYHLDGGNARQHLPRLLSLPYLRVIQYVPAPCEPPNGPDHLEMYRCIQSAGRIVHIELPWQHVEPLVRELDPALLMLDTWCPSREEGEQLLARCVKWADNATPRAVR